MEISPAKRSRIIREIHADAKREWHGSIAGHRVELRIDAGQVRWRVCVRRRWSEGVEATVWDALLVVAGDSGRVVGEPTLPLFPVGARQ